MTREERRLLLGDAVVEEIAARVAEAPAPPDSVLAALARIFSQGAPPQLIARPRTAPVQRAA